MVEIKTTGEYSVIYISGKGMSNIDKKEKKLLKFLKNRNIDKKEFTIGIFYDDPNEIRPEKVRWEIGVPINKETSLKNFKMKMLESKKVASLECGQKNIEKCFQEIYEWIKKNNYNINGPIRELYYPDKVEVQVPIVNNSNF